MLQCNCSDSFPIPHTVDPAWFVGACAPGAVVCGNVEKAAHSIRYKINTKVYIVSATLTLP